MLATVHWQLGLAQAAVVVVAAAIVLVPALVTARRRSRRRDSVTEPTSHVKLIETPEQERRRIYGEEL